MPIGWAAAITAGGSILSSVLGSNAATSAAQTQANAATNATNTQLGMFNQQFAATQPWRNIGQAGLGEMGYLLGLPGYENTGAGTPAANNYSNIPASWSTPSTTNTSAFAAGPGGLTSGSPIMLPPAGGGSAAGGTGQATVRAMPLGGSTIDFSGPGSGLAARMGTGGAGTTPISAAGGGGGSSPFGGYGSLLAPASGANLAAFWDPSYNFQLSQGLGAMANAGVGTGGLFSGNTIRGLQDYAQNYALTSYNNAFNNFNSSQANIFNRLASVSGMGQTANQTSGAVAGAMSPGISSSMQNIGASLAAGQVGSTNAITGGINSLGGLASWYAMQNPQPGTLSSNYVPSQAGTIPADWGTP